MATKLIFDQTKQDIGDQTFSWSSGIHCLLVEGTGTPAASETTVSGVLATANVTEISATDYSRPTLTSLTDALSSGVYEYGADDISFGAIGNGTNSDVSGVLIYSGTASSGDDATNVPIYFFKPDSAVTTNGTTFTVNTDDGVVFRLRDPSS